MTRIVVVTLCLALAAGAGLIVWVAMTPDAGPPGTTPEGMVWVPPGWFSMGSDEFDDAGPIHRVWVDGFWMDEAEVTNARFRAFVEATGYKTVAERVPTPEQFPKAAPEKLRDLRPFSLVFVPPATCPEEECTNCNLWWKIVHGADWRHPRGPLDTIAGKGDYPVVHVCYEDALAFCKWAGRRLPTEAEWERAARGGLDRKPYYWGDEMRPGGRWMANTYQGKFPCTDSGDDGFAGIAPVKSFPPNAYGLYDMAGNVWEWCSDLYVPGYIDVGGRGERRNPRGPGVSVDTHGNDEVKRVVRGGSFLCADVYCKRYLAGGRMQAEPTTGQNHTGFRCVLSPKDRK